MFTTALKQIQIFAARLLTTCAWRKKQENQMYQVLGWKFFAKVCSRLAVAQYKDVMPGQGSQQWVCRIFLVPSAIMSLIVLEELLAGCVKRHLNFLSP